VQVKLHITRDDTYGFRTMETFRMKLHHLLAVLIVSISIGAMIQPIHAQVLTEQKVIYQTGFAANPNWQTNNPSRNYWDPAKAMYHYSIEAGTGGYAYVPVDYDRGSFTLEYDVMPTKTDETATFRFGIGSKEMDRSRGTVVLSEFMNGKNGRLMYLRVITTSNKLVSVASGQGDEMTPSYGGPMVRFEDNRTYHVVLRYVDEQNIITMRVNEKTTGKEIWSYFVNIGTSLTGMNRIFLGSIGDYRVPEGSRTAEGYITSVRLSSDVTVPSATTGGTIQPTTVPVTLTTLPTTKTTTGMPMPTPTPESPSSYLITCMAIGMTSVFFLWYKLRIKQ